MATASIGGVNVYIPDDLTYSVTPSSTYTFPESSQYNIPTAGNIRLEAPIPGVEPLTFDFGGETKAAYDQLRDFYNRLLEFAGGRMDLAKRILEYTYQQGMREAGQEYERDMGELEIAFPQETSQLITDLNRRGVLSSGFGGQQQERLTKSQDIRKTAVERAKQNKESRLASARGFGLEESGRDFREKQFDLERERQKEAGTMAQQRYGVKSDIFGAQVSKAVSEEARRAQELANKQQFGETSTSSVPSAQAGYGKSDTEFRRYMQTTGKQGELDRATFGSTQQGAEYYALKRKYGFA